MNATIGCDSNGYWTYLGRNNDDLETNDNGTRLLTLAEECKLYIMNSLFESKPIHRHTWYSPTGFSKRVDYILTEWHIKKLSRNCRVYRKASVPFESDHRLLVLNCSFPSRSQQTTFFHKSFRQNKPETNIKSLKEEPMVGEELSNKLDQLLQDDPLIDDINQFESSFTESTY